MTPRANPRYNVDVVDLSRRLQAAIASLTSRHLTAKDYQDWMASQIALNTWSSALIRDLERLDVQLQEAAQVEIRDGVPWLEEAFFRVDAACEKMRAMLAIGLNVPYLSVVKNGVYFRLDRNPARRELKRVLDELSATSEPARGLLVIFQRLARARSYRDHVGHSLSAVADTFLVPFVDVHLDGDLQVVDTSYRYLAPEGAMDGPDIRPSTLFGRALTTAQEAAGLVAEAASLVADVLRQSGTLHPGPVVYFIDSDNGQSVVLEDPRARVEENR